jgi:hypothetical protein
MQELATRQQLKIVAEGLTLSSEISIDLLRAGKWKPTDTELLKEYLNSLHKAVLCMTELVMEQFTLAEAERILKGGN